MKNDLGVRPDQPPRKRRAVEALPALWIAEWLAGDNLTPSDRHRLQAEKDRRKASVPEHPVGVLVGTGGVTPQQLAGLPVALMGATEVHHTGVQSKVHTACKSVAPVVVHRDDPRGLIRSVTRVVAAPSSERSEVWDAVRYARHRGIPIRVVLPDGNVNEGASV